MRYATGIELIESTLTATKGDERSCIVMDHVKEAVVSGTSADDAGLDGRCQLALRETTGHWDEGNPGMAECAWQPVE